MAENPPAWTSDNFAEAMRNLWFAIAEKAEHAALDTVSIGDTIRWAQLAEAAYWQATGEGDCESLNSLALSTRTQTGVSDNG